MKKSSLFIILIVTVFLIAGIGSTAWSAPAKARKEAVRAVSKPPVKKLYRCPIGWHIKLGSFQANQTTVCVPNVPKKFECPPGTKPYISECEISCKIGPK